MRPGDLGAVAVALLAAAGSARADAPAPLAALVERALAQSPELRTAEAEVRAARARLEGASALLASNPELSGAAGARDGDAGRTAEWEVGLSQRVEVAGQRGARRAAARAALGAAEARLEAARARLASEVRELAGRAEAARLRAGLAEDARRLADDAVRAAERRAEAGDAARVEVNGARVERGRALRAALDAEQERAAARAELELLAGLEPGALPELSFTLEGAEAAAPAEALVPAALEGRRDVAAARLEVEAAEAEARLAGRATVPSPALGISVAREERADVVLGTLSLELPLFARQRAERGAAAARLDQARVAQAALERRVAAEVRLASERVRAARRLLEAFDPGLSAALAADLAAATRAYQDGQLDFVRWQLLRRDALEARRDRIDALEALNRASAQLDRALGRARPAG